MAAIENARDLIDAVDPSSILPDEPPKSGKTRDVLSALFDTRNKVYPVGDRVPAWWTRKRDEWLWDLVLKSDVLASSIFSTSARLSSIPINVVPRDQSNRNQRRLATFSDLLLKYYWQECAFQIAMDWQTQDNGVFIEVIGAGEPGGPLEPTKIPGTNDYLYAVGLRVLDSQKCLSRDTRVLLADGSRLPIIDIVRQGLSVEVMSVAPDGTIESMPITGWHETQLGNRYWLRIILSHSSKTFGRHEGITATNDHEILTTRGWVRADELVLGDKIATDYRDLTDEQAALLAGTLLGDSFISKPYSSGKSQLMMTHCAAQREWIQIKAQYLSGLDVKIKYDEERNMYDAHSDCTPVLGEWRDLWYPNGKKIVNRELVEKYFGPRLLAAWFFDDGRKIPRHNDWGYAPIEMATAGFTDEDADWLANLLVRNGIPARRTRRGDGGSGPMIYIAVEGARKFYQMVGPLAPPCLRYKLESDAPEYDSSVWEPHESPLYYDEIESISKVDNAGQQTAFCIDVARNHNFFAAGMVVHNCQRTGDPTFPVVYTHKPVGGPEKMYKFHHTRIIYRAQMSTTRRDMFGIGISGASRCVRSILRLDDINLLEDELLGARPISQLLFSRVISAEDMETAFTKADTKIIEELGNLDRRRTSRSVFVSAQGPADLVKASSIEAIDLKRLPEGYDPEVYMNLAVNIISMALGFDAREFWPATVRGATRADAEVQHLKSMRKTPGIWVGDFSKELDSKWCPSSCYITFDQQDDEQDRARAEIRQLRAQTYSQYLGGTGQSLDTKTIWQIMLEEGDITEQQYEALKTSEEFAAKAEEQQLNAEQLRAGIDHTNAQAEQTRKPDPKPAAGTGASGD